LLYVYTQERQRAACSAHP